MGELQHEAFQFPFNGFLKVAFQGSRITSDAGLLLVRELDERLGLATLIAEHLSDSRQGLNTQFSLADLLRQSVYSRLAGYEDLNDAVRVSADPTFRLIGSPTLWDRGAALTSTLHWFETELLTRAENLVGLMAVNREVLAQAEMPTRAGRIVLDMDSSESPVHGAQEGSAYNGHFESVCYHPLFLFNEHGDCVAATLRPGNVHSVDDWDDLLVPEIGSIRVSQRHFGAFRGFAWVIRWESPCGSSWKTRSVFQGAVGAFGASTVPSASTGPVRVRQDDSQGGGGPPCPRTAVDR